MALTIEERATMLELLDYPNPDGLHPCEARWREFARLEFAVYEQHVAALERQCATLAAQVDMQARVVDAAIEWKKYSLAESDNDELLEAIIDYEQQMVQLTKDDA
jgi:hypothetical protein